MNDKKITLTPSANPGTVIELGSSVFKIDQLDTAIREYFASISYAQISQSLVNKGHGRLPDRPLLSTPIRGEVMQPNGQGWQQGTIAVKVILEFEFEPDIPPEQESAADSQTSATDDSPLDALRQTEIVEG